MEIKRDIPNFEKIPFGNLQVGETFQFSPNGGICMKIQPYGHELMCGYTELETGLYESDFNSSEPVYPVKYVAVKE